jgi:hypothetical protein
VIAGEGRCILAKVTTTRGYRGALGLIAVVVACGCDATALFVGNDQRLEGGAGSALDGTTGSGGSLLTVSVAEEAPDACGGACVVLTARVTGGVAPYAYQWSPTLNSDGGVAEACPAGATKYTVTVTDSSGGKSGEFPVPGATAAAAVTVDGADACAGAMDSASFVYWADWQSADAGTAAGTLSPPSGTIQIVYTGELSGAQTASGTDAFTPSSTFTSPTVSDAPPGPGMLEVSGGPAQTDTVTFSEPVTNPVVAIYKLGTGYASETASMFFNAPVTILSSGLNGDGPMYFGNEMLLPVDGGVSGVGSNGVVELEGKFTTIQWTNPNDTQYLGYTGLTVGIRRELIP